MTTNNSPRNVVCSSSDLLAVGATVHLYDADILAVTFFDCEDWIRPFRINHRWNCLLKVLNHDRLRPGVAVIFENVFSSDGRIAAHHILDIELFCDDHVQGIFDSPFSLKVQLLANIDCHLLRDGAVIGSVTARENKNGTIVVQERCRWL